MLTCMSETRGMHPLRVVLQRQWPPMSQAKLARALDMNPAVLGRYLNGKHTTAEGFYIAAAAILGCSPDELKPNEPVAA